MLKHLLLWTAPSFTTGVLVGVAALHSLPANAARDWKWLPSMICQTKLVGYEPGRANDNIGINGGQPDVDSEVVCPIERNIMAATPMFLRVYTLGSIQCQLWVCNETGMFGAPACHTEAKSKTSAIWSWLEFLDNWNRPVQDMVSLSCSLGQNDQIAALYVWED